MRNSHRETIALVAGWLADRAEESHPAKCMTGAFHWLLAGRVDVRTICLGDNFDFSTGAVQDAVICVLEPFTDSVR